MVVAEHTLLDPERRLPAGTGSRTVTPTLVESTEVVEADGELVVLIPVQVDPQPHRLAEDLLRPVELSPTYQNGAQDGQVSCEC